MIFNSTLGLTRECSLVGARKRWTPLAIAQLAIGISLIGIIALGITVLVTISLTNLEQSFLYVIVIAWLLVIAILGRLFVLADRMNDR